VPCCPGYASWAKRGGTSSVDDLELDNRRLNARVAQLETENAQLRRDKSDYLGKWIAAQELAALRHVLLYAGWKPEAPTGVMEAGGTPATASQT
jgi:outer membrane murein-binding lipoprotein Lpp